ncbi:efflux RND transporter periplasmic adaptor subunit [Bermanella marisrubri]|uniref:Putative HlyD-like secretion protein n=1 Tax=Bermanella marisrubri TaxID=207949 RepID=Q1N4K5_9GAMM|nr:efflux RND transporter periplasmic adaptor subunit [Bermanella marisrubri]EAT13423.1 putative HlyD-like secretion protein [Oceanobacter sp. RED65] [Bermanella marisrubri]QIZ84173.1 efflux RND transporter periplasmic adaptor subunit [Bermanella marisrubri]
MRTLTTLLIGILALASYSAVANQGLPAEVINVEPQSISNKIESIGTLKANKGIILSAEVSGRITNIGFQSGDEVKQGELLFALEHSAEAAAVNEAKARVRLSQIEFDRAKTLLKKNAASQTDLDRAKANLAINQAQAESAASRLSKFKIKAPFNGMAGIHDYSEGEYINAGESLLELVDISTLNLDFFVPETNLKDVAVGQTLEISLPAFPKQNFTGEVIAISPKITETGRSLKVRARINNQKGLLKPGLFANVFLLINTQDDALLIPEQSLIPQGNQYFVMTVVDGKVNQVPVELGARKGALVQITSGINAGDTVITAGQIKLRPGMPVTALTPEMMQAKAKQQQQ